MTCWDILPGLSNLSVDLPQVELKSINYRRSVLDPSSSVVHILSNLQMLGFPQKIEFAVIMSQLCTHATT